MNQHLFLGKVKILSRDTSNNILIDAERAILIDIRNAYIYKISDGLSLAGIYSALSREKNTVDMHTLEKPQTQFLIEEDMEAIPIDSTDFGVQPYLKELKIEQGKYQFICVIAKTKGEYMIPLLFQSYTNLIKFCEAFRYYQLNKKLASMVEEIGYSNTQFISQLCEGASTGRICIDPDLFSEEKEKLEMNLTIAAMREANKYHSNSKEYSCRFAFRIQDDESINYFLRLCSCVEKEVKSIIMEECTLTDRILSNSLSKLQLSSLQTLNLSHNALTDISFRVLMQLLKKSQGLHIFHLSHNQYTLTAYNLILEFLESTTFSLQLYLSNNRIHTTEFLKQYVVHAENCPIQRIELKDNPIPDKEKLELLREMEECPTPTIIDMGLVVMSNKLSHNYINSAKQTQNQTVITVKVQKNKEVIAESNMKEEEDQPELTEKELESILMKLQEAHENLDYHEVKARMQELEGSPASEGILHEGIYRQYKHKMAEDQQQLLNSLSSLLNLQTEEATINIKLNEISRKLLRRRIEGETADMVIYLKWLRDNKIEELLAQKYDPMQQLFILQIQNCFSYYQQERSTINSFLEEDYLGLTTMSNDQLKEKGNKHLNDINIQLRCSHLLKQPPIKDVSLINIGLQQLKLPPVKLLRQTPNKRTISQLPPTIRVDNIIDFIAKYDITKFPFSRDVKEKGIFGYEGVKYPNKFEDEALLQNHSQVIVNFLKFLYHSPNEYLPETIQYLAYIVKSTLDQTASTQLVLGEEFYLHLMSFNNTLTLTKGILSSLIEFTSMYLPHSPEIQPFIHAHLIKNDTYPVEMIRFNTHNGRMLTHQLPEPKMKEAIVNHGIISVGVKIIGKGHEQSLAIHHMTTLNSFCLLLADKYEYSPDEYWLFAEANDQLVMLSPFDSVGLVLTKLKEGDELVFKRIIFPPLMWSFQLMQVVFSIEDWLQLYKQVKLNYRYYGGNLEQNQLQSALLELLLCQITLSGELKEQQVCNSYIEKIQQYLPCNSAPISVESKLKMLQTMKKRVDELLREQINYPLCLFQFIHKCHEVAYMCGVAVSDDLHSPMPNQLLLGAHGLIWIHKTLYVTKLKWPSIYQIEKKEGIIIRYANFQPSSITYHQEIKIQGNELFIDLCNVLLRRWGEVRVRSHLELLYRFTSEGGIIISQLEEVDPTNCYAQDLNRRTAMDAIISDQPQQVIKIESQPSPKKEIQSVKQMERQSQKEEKRKNSVSKMIQIEDIIEEASKEHSQEKNEEEVVITNVRRSGRRQLPRRRSSRER